MNYFVAGIFCGFGLLLVLAVTFAIICKICNSRKQADEAAWIRILRLHKRPEDYDNRG